MNLSFKSSSLASMLDDSDAPLNLSMKPDTSTPTEYSQSPSSGNGGGGGSGVTNSLQSLSSITAALGGGNTSGGNGNGGGSNDRLSANFKEGRPRNLGRGVSKPKKNTVASLLAQSRAVGLKPMLATQQLLQQGADIVRISIFKLYIHMTC